MNRQITQFLLFISPLRVHMVSNLEERPLFLGTEKSSVQLGKGHKSSLAVSKAFIKAVFSNNTFLELIDNLTVD